MKKGITRRDFLNGAALSLAAGATLTPRELLAMEQGAAPGALPKDYYPPYPHRHAGEPRGGLRGRARVGMARREAQRLHAAR